VFAPGSPLGPSHFPFSTFVSCFISFFRLLGGSRSASCRRPSSFKGQDLYDVASLFLPPDVVLIISGTCPQVGGGWRGEILVSATAVSVSPLPEYR
jgi:hypothetical protein